MKKLMVSVMVILVVTAFAYMSIVERNQVAVLPGMQRIRVGYHPTFGGTSVVAIGIEKGFFADEGLDVQLYQFTSGPPSVAALVANDIDISFVGHGVFSLILEGQAEIVAIDCLSNAEEILATQNSGVTSIRDLQGKRIAVPFGTAGENFLDAAINQFGVSRDSLSIINMDIAGCVSALARGEVDAAAIWAPYTTEARSLSKSELYTIASCMDFRDDFVLPMSWVSTKQYINNNEGTLQRFVNALYRSMDYRAAHLEEAVDMVSSMLNIPYDSLLPDIQTAEWLTSDTVWQKLQDGTIDTWYSEQRSFFIQKGAVPHPLPLEKFLHTRFIAQAVQPTAGR